MVLYINCTDNNIPSSTSSCTDLIYEACPPQDICVSHCHKCCLNNMLNDHTYGVLKKICKKIINDFNRQQCREKYTVFDGGNSVNVRIHHSLPTTAGAHKCGTPYFNANEISDQFGLKNKNTVSSPNVDSPKKISGTFKNIKTLDVEKSNIKSRRRNKRDEVFDNEDIKDIFGKKDKKRPSKKQKDDDKDKRRTSKKLEDDDKDNRVIFGKKEKKRPSKKLEDDDKDNKKDNKKDKRRPSKKQEDDDKDNKEIFGKKDKRRPTKKLEDDDKDNKDRFGKKDKRRSTKKLEDDDKDNRDIFGKKDKRRSKKKKEDDDVDERTRKQIDAAKPKPRRSKRDEVDEDKTRSKKKQVDEEKKKPNKHKNNENEADFMADKMRKRKSKGRKPEQDADDEEAKSKRKVKSSKNVAALPIVSDLRFKVRKGQDVGFVKDIKKAKSTPLALDKLSRRYSDNYNRNTRLLRYVKPSRIDQIRFCDFLRANMEQRELCTNSEICRCDHSENTCCVPCSPCEPYNSCEPNNCDQF